jgi:hypothetical protein
MSLSVPWFLTDTILTINTNTYVILCVSRQRFHAGCGAANFNTLLNQDVLIKNPSQGVEAKLPSQRQQKARVPYTDADIQAIFSSPVFTDDARSNGCAGEAARWLSPPVCREACSVCHR